MRAPLLVPLLALCAGAPAPAQGTLWTSALPPGRSRVFVSPDLYANRLLDWRLEDGWAHCVTGAPRRPMRTLMLLTRELAPTPGDLEVELVVRPPAAPDGVEPAGAGEEARAASWAGLLLGVGGPHVEYRISALCQGWPGIDGGWFAGVDGLGRLVVRDNGHGEGPRGANAKLRPSDWPLVAASEAAGPWSEPLRLRLSLADQENRSRLLLRLFDAAGEVERARLAVEDVPASARDGLVGLVSHGSPFGRGEGYAFRDVRLSGSKLRAHPERRFGPIVAALYTLSGGTLRMTAQLVPLGEDDARRVRLEVHGESGWRPVAEAEMVPGSSTAHLEVRDWDATRERPYRLVRVGTDGAALPEPPYEGRIRREPLGRDPLVVAGLSCVDISSAGDKNWNRGGFWFPHEDLVAHLEAHDPDLVVFLGDQIYEGGLEGIVRAPLEAAELDYLAHWYRFLWAFRDLLRDRPSVCLPDDHDVYHGNIWGAGGERAPKDPRFRYDSDRGGYMMPTEWVNAVHRTQVAHLPAPFDPKPLACGIGVYYTSLEYAGVSFGIVADRMWKSAPAVVMPEARVENGWIQAEGFDPRTQADPPGARLLGERQLAFLEHWTEDWRPETWTKVLLSQTIFSNVATIPAGAKSGAVLPRLEYPAPGEWIEGDRLAADCDSGGWPPSGRDRALRIVRRASMFHLAGDQHLPSFTRYGLDGFGDGPYAFCVPAVANLWPRRFFPPEPPANQPPGAPRYVGDLLDGFGNRVTVLAVANPMRSGVEPTALYDRNPGYGIVRLSRSRRSITAECWPRWVDPLAEDARQFPGWPITVDLDEAFRGGTVAALPEIRAPGRPGFLVRWYADDTGELVQVRRAAGERFTPFVRREVPHTVVVDLPDGGQFRREGVAPGSPGAAPAWVLD